MGLLDTMTQTPAAMLGVERSHGGRRWIARPTDARLALALAQQQGLPELVGRVLTARGIGLDDVESFLRPTLRTLLPDPSHLKDMDVAAARIARAVQAGEPIAIFGDYDVDGATSTALLGRFLRTVGADVRYYIPDRIAEGYGPNAPALLRLGQEGARLIITVDCGVSAFEPLEAAAEAGIDVVVFDHHVAEARLPRAVAVVNPNRLDETSPYRYLAAVGVCFLAVVAVNRALRVAGHYADRPEPDLMLWLDLVALGTVCDVVPLKGLNRGLVAQGLKVMARRRNVGLAALADVGRLQEAPGAYHAGYILGPRVNAGGRVGQADLGARLLQCDDPSEAMRLALILDRHNEERRALEQVVLQDAVGRVEAKHRDQARLVMVAGEGWHPGVIGIVASRLKEQFNLPAIVVSVTDGIGKASGRSVRGVDLGGAVIAARQAGLLVNGGGHAMAAGFTAEADKLPELESFLEERIAAQLEGRALVPTLELDGTLSVSGATIELLERLEQLGPFGTGNAEPRFAIADARVIRADVVGESHVRCIFADSSGGRLKGIAFRCLDTPLGSALLGSLGQNLHIAGTLRIDSWNGNRAPQILIDDAAPSNGGAGIGAKELAMRAWSR